MKPDEVPNLQARSLLYILSYAQVFLLVLDKTGTIMFANRYASHLAGVELERRHLKEIILLDSWQDTILDTWTSRETPPLMNIRMKNDLPRTLYITVYREDSLYLLFGHMDSEELQYVSKEIIELNKELNSKSRELNIRNAELSRLNALKNQFLGMAAHDLRNPVGIILNYADFLIEDLAGELSSEHLNFLNNIRSAAEDMKQVINDFLDVSIIESGHLTLTITETDPRDLIEDSIGKVIHTAERYGITFHTTIDPTLSNIIVDQHKIKQVLINLIKNAIEYSPKGGVIRISVTLIHDEIQVMVKDEGAGISTERQEVLFQDFSGTKSTKKDGERSVGLGLVISRKIVEAHRGRMYLESEPGTGSTFGFILPASAIATSLLTKDP
ncbi:MAG: HAMP domain-containing histidine kinase [Methanospirillaceae archaeon]|nr:HAMP domain-containing histidine kinase [Methanospirillaceae archaeon]